MGNSPAKSNALILIILFLALSAKLWWIHYTADFAYFTNDTSVVYGKFKFVYDAIYNHQEFPLWNPHFGLGVPAGYWYFFLSPIDFTAIFFGELFSVRNVYLLFITSIFLHSFIGVMFWLCLSDYLEFPPLAKIFVSFAFVVGFSGEDYVTFSVKALYLVPVLILFLIRLAENSKIIWLSLLLIVWSFSIFGNIPYVVVASFYALAAFGIVYFVSVKSLKYDDIKRNVFQFDRKTVFRGTLFLAKNKLLWFASITCLTFLFVYFYVFVLRDVYSLNTVLLRSGRSESLNITFEEFTSYNRDFWHFSKLAVPSYWPRLSMYFFPSNGSGLYVFPAVIFFSTLNFLFPSNPLKRTLFILLIFGIGLLLPYSSSLLKSVLFFLPFLDFVRFHEVLIISFIHIALILASGLGLSELVNFLKNKERNNQLKTQNLHIVFFLNAIFAMTLIYNTAWWNFDNDTKSLSSGLAITVLCLYLSFGLVFSLLISVNSDRRRISGADNSLIYLSIFFCIASFSFLTILSGSSASSNDVKAYISNIKNENRHKVFFDSTEYYVTPPQNLTTRRSQQQIYDATQQVRRYHQMHNPKIWNPHELWRAATGLTACSPSLSAQQLSWQAINFLRTFKLRDRYWWSQNEYDLNLAEGAGGIAGYLDSFEYFKHAAACNSSVIRISDNPVVLTSNFPRLEALFWAINQRGTIRDIIHPDDAFREQQPFIASSKLPEHPNYDNAVSYFSTVKSNIPLELLSRGLDKLDSRIFGDKAELVPFDSKNRSVHLSRFSGGSSIIGAKNGWQIIPSDKYDFSEFDFSIDWQSRFIVDQFTGQEHYIFDWISSSGQRLAVAFNDGQVIIQTSKGEHRYAQKVDKNVWLHFVIQRRGGRLEFIINGDVVHAEIDSNKYDFASTKDHLVFGQDSKKNLPASQLVYFTEIRIRSGEGFHAEHPDEILVDQAFANLDVSKIMTLVQSASKGSARFSLDEDPKIVKYSPNQLSIKAKTQSNVWLIFSDSFDPRWTAIINGHKTKIFNSNFAFKAVQLKKGLNDVLFTYKDALLYWSLFLISKVSLIAFFAALVSPFQSYLLTNTRKPSKIDRT